MKEDKVTSEPEGQQFNCWLKEFDDSTSIKEFDKMAYSPCKIKTMATPSGKAMLNNLT